MTITRQPTAREIGQVFAARVRDETVARDLWVTSECDGVHLWLLIDPIEHDDVELGLYGLIDVLDERFPDAAFQLHILNPVDFVADPRASLPGHAERIGLRAA